MRDIDIDRERKCRMFAILHISQYVVMIIGGIEIIQKYKMFLGGVIFHNLFHAKRMLPLAIGTIIIYNLVLKSLGYFWYVEEAKKLKCGVVLSFLDYDIAFTLVYYNKSPVFLIVFAIILILLQFVIDHYIPYGRFF